MLRYLAKSLWLLGLADSGFCEFAFVGERKIDALWTSDDHVAGLLAAVMRRGLKSVCETHFDPAETDMNYCGIDLHSNNCVVIVSDDNDRIVYQKRLPNELAQVAAALEPYRHELVGVVVESTYYGRLGIMHGSSLRELKCAA